MRSRSSFRRVLPLVLILPLAGCKKWEPASLSPRQALADDGPSSVRVTTADGAQVTLRNPTFVNDSLVAAVAPPPGAVVIPPRTGVLESDINVIEVPSLDTGRTLLLLGAIAGASINWARIQGSGGGSEPKPDPLPKDTAFDLIGAIRFLWSLR